MAPRPLSELRCPHCNKPFQIEIGLRSSREEKLISLADGTRTGRELAELTGYTQSGLPNVIKRLNKDGHRLRVKPPLLDTPTNMLPFEVKDHWLERYLDGDSIKKIANSTTWSWGFVNRVLQNHKWTSSRPGYNKQEHTYFGKKSWYEYLCADAAGEFDQQKFVNLPLRGSVV